MDISRVTPASITYLYKTIVLPSILYGCELWNHTHNEDLRRLNMLQRGIIKQILGLPKLTQSDVCKQLLNILQISAEIDYRKLLFLGRLCRMNTDVNHIEQRFDPSARGSIVKSGSSRLICYYFFLEKIFVI